MFLKHWIEKSHRVIQINATVVYRCSKVINRLRENKSGLQTKTEYNTSTIREKQRNNRILKYNKSQTTMQHTYISTNYYKPCHTCRLSEC